MISRRNFITAVSAAFAALNPFARLALAKRQQAYGVSGWRRAVLAYPAFLVYSGRVDELTGKPLVYKVWAVAPKWRNSKLPAIPAEDLSNIVPVLSEIEECKRYIPEPIWGCVRFVMLAPDNSPWPLNPLTPVWGLRPFGNVEYGADMQQVETLEVGTIRLRWFQRLTAEVERTEADLWRIAFNPNGTYEI